MTSAKDTFGNEVRIVHKRRRQSRKTAGRHFVGGRVAGWHFNQWALQTTFGVEKGRQCDKWV
jgi:hypothetical protein